MYSFLIALAVLIVGYFFYGSFVEKVFGVDNNRSVPAYTKTDGVDFVPMPTWKVFLIQFLNIAGLGPIFGAIMGIQYGPAAFLWISLGTIFAGGVHDFLTGVICVRSDGTSIPEIIGNELGITVKHCMRLFALLLMILVAAVFVINPAELLKLLTAGVAGGILTTDFWIFVIFVYFILASLLPIDKLVGRLYPVFGFALLFMAVGILIVLISSKLEFIPEFSTGLQNRFVNPETNRMFPLMFVSIACGAISGFHATQTPMMARCLKNEKYSRPVFYGAMVAEGIVALIWAAAAIAFFRGDFSALSDFLHQSKSASPLVNTLSREWLGTVGGVLAVLGVIVAPISSGDTALRSARLIVADVLKIKQSKLWHRLSISLPIFVLTFIVMKIDFTVLWRYFGWCNQTLAMFSLWAVTVYLKRNGRRYIFALLPSLFMTMVCISYIIFAPEGFSLDNSLAEWLSTKFNYTAISIEYYISIITAAVITLTLLFVLIAKTKQYKTIINN